MDAVVLPLAVMENSISVEELRSLLEQGKPVAIVDVRTEADRSDWWIAGSRHIDAYAALQAGGAGLLGSTQFTTETPLVTVCGVGKTAALATQHLRARGLNALTLSGGMRAWSLAWNTAEVVLPGSSTRVIQIRRTGKGCLSYLIGSDHEAVAIDPSLDVDVYTRVAGRCGWHITQVIETHVHADHVSRARQLATATGARLRLPAQGRVKFEHAPISDGDQIDVGATTLTALRTPGHTDESTSYLTDGAIFTGDTLFLATVGRPDLGAESRDVSARAAELCRSVKRLLDLTPATMVLPGHSSQPIAFDRIPIAARLSEVRGRLLSLVGDEAEFVAHVLERLPAPPPNHATIVGINEAGTSPGVDIVDLEAGGNRCAVA